MALVVGLSRDTIMICHKDEGWLSSTHSDCKSVIEVVTPPSNPTRVLGVVCANTNSYTKVASLFTWMEICKYKTSFKLLVSWILALTSLVICDAKIKRDLLTYGND